MRAGDEEIGAEVGHGLVLDTEAVRAVHAQQCAVRRVSPVVVLGDGGGDLRDRQAHAGAGVDPRDGHDTGRRHDRLGEPADDLVDRCVRRVVVETDPVDRAAAALGAQSQRFVRRVEVMLGGQHPLASADDDAPVEETEAHRRAVGQCDLPGRCAEIVSGCGRHGLLQLSLMLQQVAMGVGIEAGAVAGDGLGHRSRMGGQREGAEVRNVGTERELLAHRRPIGRVQLDISVRG